MSNDFTLPNAEYMLASMATMGLHSRPLLEICCQKIEGKKKLLRKQTMLNRIKTMHHVRLWLSPITSLFVR